MCYILPVDEVPVYGEARFWKVLLEIGRVVRVCGDCDLTFDDLSCEEVEDDATGEVVFPKAPEVISCGKVVKSGVGDVALPSEFASKLSL